MHAHPIFSFQSWLFIISRCLTSMAEYIGDDEVVFFAVSLSICNGLYLLLQVAFRGLIAKVVPAIQQLLAESEVRAIHDCTIVSSLLCEGSCVWGHGTVWWVDRMWGCHNNTLSLLLTRILSHSEYILHTLLTLPTPTCTYTDQHNGLWI